MLHFSLKEARNLVQDGGVTFVPYNNPRVQALLPALNQVKEHNRMVQVLVDQTRRQERLGIVTTPTGVYVLSVDESHDAWAYFDDERTVVIKNNQYFLFDDDMDKSVYRPGAMLHVQVSNSTTLGGPYYIVRPDYYRNSYTADIQQRVITRLTGSGDKARELILSGKRVSYRNIDWRVGENTVASLHLSINIPNGRLFNQVISSYLASNAEGIENFAAFLGSWCCQHLFDTETFFINGFKVVIENNGAERAVPVSKKAGRSFSINGFGARQDDIAELFRAFLCLRSEEDISQIVASTKEIPLRVRQRMIGEYPVQVEVPANIRRQYNLPYTTPVPIKFTLDKDGKTFVASVAGKTFPVISKQRFLNWCGSGDSSLNDELITSMFGDGVRDYLSADLNDIIKQYKDGFEKSRVLLKNTLAQYNGRIEGHALYVTGSSGNEYKVDVNPEAPYNDPPHALTGDGHIPVFHNGRSICIVCRAEGALGYDRVTSVIIALAHDEQVVGRVGTLAAHLPRGGRNND